MACAKKTASVSVLEHAFCVESEGHPVPAMLWRPAGTGSCFPPLVLLGHGGSGHKRSDRIVDLAHWFVQKARIAALAIDGPYHGDRLRQPLTAREYQARIAEEGAANVVERMKGDWRATIDAVTELRVAATDVLGFIGLSMGSRYGLPLAAELGDRLRCAVFGKFGLEQSLSLPRALDTADVTRRAADQVRARTLFHVQWDDEVFPRKGQFALFESLGSDDKRLIAYPGRHGETHPDAVSVWQEFVAAGLT